MLIITILSLLMAATMGWLALRLMREEQRRSEARVAALTAALDEPWGPVAYEPGPGVASPSVAPQPAWAPRRTEDPPRVSSRPVTQPPTPEIVTVDDHDMTDTLFASAVEPAAASASVRGELEARGEEPRPMFGADVDDAPPQDDRRWLAIAAVVLVGLGIMSVLWSTSGTSHTESTQAKAATVAPGGVPVELLSLGHERTASGLLIRGLVRNPSAGSTRTGTAASVFLFDEAGGFLGSGRSVLDTPTLAPGDEAAFEVSLPGDAKVRRYRVTFRGMDGTVVPHVDKRQPAAPARPGQ